VLRVTCDTNIFISGLNYQGKPFDILTLARSGVIELAVSDPIMEEIKRVLGLKFHWPEEDIAFIEKRIASFSKHVAPSQTIDAVKEDPTDNRILECAAAGGSEYLVTGDKHLLKLGQLAGTKIVTAAEFLEIMAQQGRRRR
jgi:putative PIN family toxin of toxin-antitoxin system